MGLNRGGYSGRHLGGIAMPYSTWYEFKKDLEKHLGHSLLNWRWLEVKPKAPLPWNDSHMKAVVARLDDHKGCAKTDDERLSTGAGGLLNKTTSPSEVCGRSMP